MSCSHSFPSYSPSSEYQGISDSNMSRKQNTSCDQCRKGKRACDLFFIQHSQWQDESSPASDSPPSLQSGGSEYQTTAKSKCTNCAKTNKTCTLEWVLSQKSRPVQRGQSMNSNSSRPKQLAPAPGSICQISENEDLENAVETGNMEGIPGMNKSTLYEMPGIMDPVTQANIEGWDMFMGNSFAAADMSMNREAFQAFNESSSLGFSPFASTSSQSQLCFEDQGLDTSLYREKSSLVTSPLDQISSRFTRDISGTTTAADVRMRNEGIRRRRLRKSGLSNQRRQSAITSFGAGQHQFVSRTNNILATENLMQVYHDVMEGALSCWLTEQTCPYNRTIPGAMIPGETMTLEWGPNWSNRILNRVLKLDRAAPGLGITPLSPSQNRDANRALRLAIMAFATQWSQSSQRSQEKYSPGTWGMLLEPDAEFFQGFDRTIQKSFWNQARSVLDSCSELDSFTVAYAEIIFGLTHKYIEDGNHGRVTDLDAHGDICSSVGDTLKSDPSSLYLERAARKVHVLKSKVEMQEWRRKGHEGGKSQNHEHVQTIGLLYWLAIMFDTISSAMTERPLTVTDEDSQGSTETEHGLYSPGLDPTRWNETPILYPQDPLPGAYPPRWPCSEAVVAKVLTQAAPVKVLLFRKVTTLQSLVARGNRGFVMEKAIQEALLVYQHWNQAYGPLFDDFVDQHESLPPRIQSWYVCLFGHWLLGALLLAQLIHDIDERRLCLATSSQERMQDLVAQNILWDSVRTISDLANVSTPQDGGRPLQQFHSSVNEGALLTEPWTMILIRVFGLAGAMLLQSPIAMGRRGVNVDQDVNESEDNISRCEDCIKALWHLGKKSDSARQVAGMLSTALRKRRLLKVENQIEFGERLVDVSSAIAT